MYMNHDSDSSAFNSVTVLHQHQVSFTELLKKSNNIIFEMSFVSQKQ